MKYILLPIDKQDLTMILSDDKEFIFTNHISNKWRTNDILYLYEKLGKKIKCPTCKGTGGVMQPGIPFPDGWMICSDCLKYEKYCRIGRKYQGSGRVLATAEIEEIIVDVMKVKSDGVFNLLGGQTQDYISRYLDLSGAQRIGYTNQKYTIKLKNIKRIDYSLTNLGIESVPKRFAYIKDGYPKEIIVNG